MNRKSGVFGSKVTSWKFFDGVKHSHVPDLEVILKGKVNVADLVVQGVEQPGNFTQVVDAKTGTEVGETTKGGYSD